METVILPLSEETGLRIVALLQRIADAVAPTSDGGATYDDDGYLVTSNAYIDEDGFLVTTATVGEDGYLTF